MRGLEKGERKIVEAVKGVNFGKRPGFCDGVLEFKVNADFRLEGGVESQSVSDLWYPICQVFS